MMKCELCSKETYIIHIGNKGKICDKCYDKNMKICSKCEIKKDLSEFYKIGIKNNNLRAICKQCTNNNNNNWRKNNKERILKQRKKYCEENKEQKAVYMKKYREKNPEYNQKYYQENKKQIIKQNKIYSNSKAKYDTYASQIEWTKDPVRNIDGCFQTKCTYCGKWYFPIVSTIQDRIKALNKSSGSENRLYCSTECKTACPIFKKQKYQEGYPLKNENSSREVQPELRQMVFERDNYTCLKCGKHQDDLLNVPLHCHHIEGILWNPLESADMDICVTVCKDCHTKIHQQKGCGYNDMQCN